MSLGWLGVLSIAVTAFLDAALVPISVQALLVGAALAYPQWAWMLVGVYALASAAGSCVGYSLGRYGLATPLLRRFPPEKVKQAQTQMRRYGPFIVALGGTTPLPFPLFTIAAGMFRVSLPLLLLAVSIGRGAKAVLFVFVSAHIGRPVLDQTVKHHSGLIIGVAVLVALVGTWLGWRSWQKKVASPLTGDGRLNDRRG
ncbi:hypothetical protein HRbin17_01330 [bacterium HR17]|jgi:undecaprenyl-diphosphatase|uniref:VTT domain-containing protein n=1 Tax=Candidatus Fervidibacter japonicus TaxID=2035412 RepID=A0A2H5XCC7_9BACT|nr:hypothetical protein HRbin17_01330 [bacterium HR17]